LEVLCRRLRRADERMIDILFFDLEVRLAKLLLRQTESVTGPEPGPRTSKLGISQRELGSLVGGRRESVNRCLQGWQRQGLIRLRDGWIVIEAPAKLREIIERF
jgi:CRP-like cAMP-binding protein